MIELSKKLVPINDSFLQDLKFKWFNESHSNSTYNDFIPIATEWFKSSKLNTLYGWENFQYVDVILGCTHFIESFIIKYGLDGFQILENEYSYYGMLGKHGVMIDQLEENVPLIVSLPNWHYADLVPNFEYLLDQCYKKNVDVHIDFAWITAARDINIDLNHPNIKSFAMSMSKYSLEWNRIGLRWTKQRTVDSITIMNHYHGDINSNLTSCGVFMIENIPRDYTWHTYGKQYYKLCQDNNFISTKLINVVKIPNEDRSYGVGHIFSI